MIVTEREREAETQAEGEAGSMHREPNVGFDPGSPGSRPGPKAGAKPLRHPGIPINKILKKKNPALGVYSYLDNEMCHLSSDGCRGFLQVGVSLSNPRDQDKRSLILLS